ncbi:Adenine phosphoribosyltransferase 5, partial [Cucurbita argyrosperma subsp. sororia]
MFAAENGLKGDPRLQGISQAIRVVPHFPKPGIMFQDITTLLLDHKAFKDTVDIFVDRYRGMNISVVAGVEARGFMFGPSIALAIGAKFVPLRKPRKLPGEVISEAYDLEYGNDCLEMQIDAQSGFWNGWVLKWLNVVVWLDYAKLRDSAGLMESRFISLLNHANWMVVFKVGVDMDDERASA